MIPAEELSNALKKKRLKIGKNQKDISILCDLSTTQISRIENNEINYSHKNAYQLWETLKELEEDYETAEDVMIENITWASPKDTILEIRKVMRKNDYSQLPVKKDGEHIGRIDSKILMGVRNPDKQVQEYIGPKYSEVNPQTPVESIRELVKEDAAVIVIEEGDYKGLITRSDII